MKLPRTLHCSFRLLEKFAFPRAGHSFLHFGQVMPHVHTKFCNDVALLMSEPDRKARKKLKKYIQEGNTKRVKKLIKHGVVNINSIIDRKKGWGALHLACYHGQWRLVTFLVNNGSDPSLLDCNLSLPLHILLHKACEWVKYDFAMPSLNIMLESILLLLYSNQEIDMTSFRVADNEGIAVIDLIEYLVESLNDIDLLKDRDCPLFKELVEFVSNISTQTDEAIWNEKIQDYCSDDMQGPFEGFADYSTSESFSAFADRIAEEWKERKRKHEEEKHINRKKAKPQGTELLILKPELPKLDILRVQKEAYEEKYQLFLAEEHKRISFDDIPWPGGSHATSAEQAKICLYSADTDVSKTVTREQQRRWHPDKFIQLYGQCLSEDDRDKILDHVKQLSQSINNFNMA